MPPAARVGDFHACPMISGTVPHVGGPILGPGANSVHVGGLPAAVLGDVATCAGALDSITAGSSSVKFEGKPAARVGDGTAHGGTILAGAFNVMVGG